MELHSRSLSLGSLLAGSSRILIKRFGVFLGIVFVPSAFLALVSIPLLWSFRRAHQLDPTSFYRSLSWFGKAPAIAGMFALFALVFRANVAAIRVASEDYQGLSIGVVEAYKRIRRKSLRLQWLVLVGSLFLGPLSIIVGSAAAMLCLPALPAAVVEHLGVREALKRTYGLMYGKWGSLVAVFVICLATTILLVVGGSMILGVVAHPLSYWGHPILLAALMAALLLPSQWLFISFTLVYHDGLDRRPGLSPEANSLAPTTSTGWARFERAHPDAWALLVGFGLLFALGLAFIRALVELGGRPATAQAWWGYITGATFGPLILACLGVGIYYAVRKTRRTQRGVISVIVGWTVLFSLLGFAGTAERNGRSPHFPRGEQESGRMMRQAYKEASGAVPPDQYSKDELATTMREMFQDVIQFRQQHQEAIGQFDTSEISHLYAASSFRDRRTVEETMRQLRSMESVEQQFSSLESVFAKTKARIQRTNWPEQSKRDFVRGTEESLAKMSQSRLAVYQTEQKWIDASLTLYTFALNYLSDISVRQNQVVIKDRATRETFNQMLNRAVDLRQEVLRSSKQYDQENATNVKKYGLSPSDLGLK